MNLKLEVIKFMQNNSAPIDDKWFHALADKLGIEHSELESTAYNLLSSFFNAGRAKEKKLKVKDINKKELLELFS